jgi:hypothetical protein
VSPVELAAQLFFERDLMSFDLCILDVDKSFTVEQVKEIYWKLCEGDYVAKPSDKIAPFFEELCRAYPQIDEVSEDELDDCPWTNAHDIYDGHMIT